MKTDIHPKLNPVVFVDTSCGAEFVTTSTLTSDKTKTIDGVKHYVINVEISSASHPFYTGKQVLVDTAGRVDKFRARQEIAKKHKAEQEVRTKKRVSNKKETLEEKVIRKVEEKEKVRAVEKAEKAVIKKAAAKKAAAKITVKPAKKAEEEKKPVAKKPAVKKVATKKSTTKKK